MKIKVIKAMIIEEEVEINDPVFIKFANTENPSQALVKKKPLSNSRIIFVLCMTQKPISVYLNIKKRGRKLPLFSAARALAPRAEFKKIYNLTNFSTHFLDILPRLNFPKTLDKTHPLCYNTDVR